MSAITHPPHFTEAITSEKSRRMIDQPSKAFASQDFGGQASIVASFYKSWAFLVSCLSYLLTLQDLRKCFKYLIFFQQGMVSKFDSPNNSVCTVVLLL
jgi:hypothetical protein